jgi:putative FmdB family regulatory protein
MPTYEYACTECGRHIEVVQSMSDAPLGECGACGGRLRKVFSPIGIVFKGSGFYKTDSRKSTADRKAGTSSPSSTESGNSSPSTPGGSSSSEGSSGSSSSSSGSTSGKAADSA